MPRPRKSMAEHRASGAVAKNPQRFREREDEIEPELGIGEPPAEFLNAQSGLSKLKLEGWHLLVDSAPSGVLTKMDRGYVIAVSRLYAEASRYGATGKEQKRYIEALKEAPFTPKARAGFAIRRQKAADEANRNPFSKFAGTHQLPPRVQ